MRHPSPFTGYPGWPLPRARSGQARTGEPSVASGPKSRAKTSAQHEPEVAYISKGKARKRCEFGTKVTLATTIDEGFVVGMRALPGNPYDGNTLPETLEQVAIQTGQTPALVVVDQGYHGHAVLSTKVLISGTRRGTDANTEEFPETALRPLSWFASKPLPAIIKPEIGHLKTDGRLSRCPLKGTFGDDIFAVPCGFGHNIRGVLADLRALLARARAVGMVSEPRGSYERQAAAIAAIAPRVGSVRRRCLGGSCRLIKAA